MQQWISIWGYRPMNYEKFPLVVTKGVLRVSFLCNVTGKRARLRLSNEFGNVPIRIAELWLENSRGDSVPITLRGHKYIVLNPRETTYSDVVVFPVQAGEYLTIIVRVEENQRITTACSCFAQDAVQVWWNENHQIPTELLNREPEHQCFFGFCRVDVETEDDVRTLVCFGDSITHRSLYTSPLATALYKRYPGRVTLINCGVSGNRITGDASSLSPCGAWFGQQATRRLEGDVFAGTRVDAVSVLLGINDIFHPLCGDAPREETRNTAALTAGLAAMADTVHAHGAKVIGATITPWKNCLGLFAEEPESVREATNRWIRTNSIFDAVWDFSSMIADPNNPLQMRPDCDSGDHVHPGPKGGAVMAQGIDLKQLAQLMGLEAE